MTRMWYGKMVKRTVGTQICLSEFQLHCQADYLILLTFRLLRSKMMIVMLTSLIKWLRILRGNSVYTLLSIVCGTQQGIIHWLLFSFSAHSIHGPLPGALDTKVKLQSYSRKAGSIALSSFILCLRRSLWWVFPK